MILRVVHTNLLPDILHQFSQEQGLIQTDDWTLSQALLKALAQVLGFIPQSGRVGEVKGMLCLRVWVVE